jgi:hypothetical protein
MNQSLYIIIYIILSVVIILFQIGLAIGMPWGSASMGGRFPGKYPSKMRIVAIINAIIILGIMVIVLSRSGLILPQLFSFSKIAIWFIVIFFGLGTIMNIITPSKIERIWAPIVAIQLLITLSIALS